MNKELMFSSRNENWETPNDLFGYCFAKYGPFTLDVCASEGNCKVFLYYSKDDDALFQSWNGRCWMNPPYGRGIKHWVKKAHDSVLVDHTAEIVCCLLPARTDTKWFHEYIWDATNQCPRPDTIVEFIQGRLKFLEEGEEKDSAPFPSMIVVFKK